MTNQVHLITLDILSEFEDHLLSVFQKKLTKIAGAPKRRSLEKAICSLKEALLYSVLKPRSKNSAILFCFLKSFTH